MTVGARDYIDQLLVQKYAEEKVDNHDENALISKVDAQEMLNAMDVAGNHYRNMLALNTRLTVMCYGIVAKTAKYVPLEDVA